MPDLNTIFTGVTPSPVREWVGMVYASGTFERVVLPCVGRFGALLAIRSMGAAPEQIEASDVSLFSSVVGYLCDPTRSIADLRIRPEGRAEAFVDGADSEDEFAAGVLVGLKYLQTPPSNLFNAGFRTEVWRNRKKYRDNVRVQLGKIVEAIGPIRYDVADARDVVADVAGYDDEATFFYVGPPNYAHGYSRMFGIAEGAFHWSELVTRELLPEDCWTMLDTLTEAPATCVALVYPGKTDAPPEWVRIGAVERKPGAVEMVVANKDVADRMVSARCTANNPRTFPIYDDEEITEQSDVRFVLVDRDTGLYYRDLFVHRLGSTIAQVHLVMLVDGRVVASLGFHLRNFLTGRSEDIGETYGVSRTSQRYARIAKLAALARSSGDMRRFLMAPGGPIRRQLREPGGVHTTVLTHHPEDKGMRSVAKMLSREKLPDGTYKLQYRSEFRDDTWADVVRTWVRRWGHDHRPGWDCDTCEEKVDGSD